MWRKSLLKPGGNQKLFLAYSLWKYSFSMIEEHIWHKVMNTVKFNFFFHIISRVLPYLADWELEVSYSVCPMENTPVYTGNSKSICSVRTWQTAKQNLDDEKIMISYDDPMWWKKSLIFSISLSIYVLNIHPNEYLSVISKTGTWGDLRKMLTKQTLHRFREKL